MDFTEAYTDTCSTLGMAARIGSVERMNTLLSQGRPADVADNRGWRPLHEAANSGSVACLKILLQQECNDVNWTSFDEETAVHLAVRQGHAECVKILIESGANINIPNDMNCTPVLTAVKTENDQCLRILVEAGADVNIQPHGGRGPLHQAAALGSLEIMSYLLSHDARIDIEEDYNITPIFLAAQFGKYDCLKALLQKAEETGQNHLVNKEAVDNATPLFLAAQEGHTECVKLLIEKGADTNISVETCGMKALALDVAIEFEHIECVKMLYPITDQSVPGRINPLVLACQTRENRALQYMIEVTPDISQQICLQPGRTFAPDYLENVDVEYSTKASALALVSVFDSGMVNAERLIAAGAEVNACMRHSIPPLVPAISAEDHNLIRLLISKGAVVNVYHPKVIPNMVVTAALANYKLLAELLFMGAEAESSFYTDGSEHQQFDSCKMSVVSDCQECSENQDSVFPGDRLGLADILSRKPALWDGKGYYFLSLLLQFVGNVQLDTRLRNHVSREKLWRSITQFTEEPRQLSHLCRIKIRSIVKSSCLLDDNWVEEFPLPKPVKLYLSYHSFRAEIAHGGHYTIPPI